MGVVKIAILSMMVIYLQSSYANAQVSDRGVDVNFAGNVYEIELSAISISGEYSGRYLASGFKNNAGYISYYIVEVDKGNGKSRYWKLADEVSQFIERKGNLYAVSNGGKLLKLEGDEWKPDFTIKPRSYVVQSDPLIACSWGDDTLDPRHRLDPGCYSPDLGWKNDVFWSATIVEPKICHGQLKVLVSDHRKHALHWEILVMNPESGEEIGQIPTPEPRLGMDVCNYELEK
ncbi:hypothetical protein [Gallaecimonas xiamenensis]|uniref:hypothetical protein n=1 Tax=Gallaecimonas xiamenensis TaxID=1207039 RepID=UPI00054F53F5|nr:hypothetical protein [Gallaecimonas xiamenensis]